MRKISLLLILLLSSVLFLSAQELKITGTVIDSKDNQPIIGASVIVKGTTRGVVTDIDGKFSISAEIGNVLQATYVGYQSAEVVISGQTNYTFVLTESSIGLDEVVVVGYGTVRREDATGAVTSMNVSPTLKGAVTNPQELLLGKIAGVSVTQGGGAATSATTIRIRGGSSLSAKNDPLIVVDGVPLDNSGVAGVGNLLSSINPNDIATFSVLKDASAAAIYGSRASNGVIIITTKKGLSQTGIKVSYDGNVSVSTPTKLISTLNAGEFKTLLKERLSEEQYNYAETQFGTEDTNWQKQIFRTSVSTDHNVSINAGVNSKYMQLPLRASFGYTNSNGMLKGDHMERFTGNISLNPSFFDNHLKVNINAKLMSSSSQFVDNGAIGNALRFDPTQAVRNPHDPSGYYTYRTPDGKARDLAPRNPVALLDRQFKTDDGTALNFIGNIQIDYKLHFLPDLSFNLNLGMDNSASNRNKWRNPKSPTEFNEPGYEEIWKQKRNNQLLDFYIQYQKEIEPIKSRINVMAGYSYQYYWLEDKKESYKDLDNPAGKVVAARPTTIPTDYAIVSFFGRLNYSLMNKYLLTFTLRNDNSSRFSKENRSGIFPSVALAWRINEESFLQSADAVSDLKLRLGWGTTGQQDIDKGNYPYIGSYSATSSTTTYALMGFDAAGNPIWVSPVRPDGYNPNLKWETTITWNAGLDYAFLKNRLYGSLDFYLRTTKDLINSEIKAPSGVNFSEYIPQNIGTFENRGVEVALNGVAVDTKDWRLDLGANFALNKNKITELVMVSEGDPGRRYLEYDRHLLKIHSLNQPAGQFFVYEQIYNANGKPIEGLYVDRNKDGMINEKDLRQYKNSTPDYTFGFNAVLRYKNFDLSTSLRANIGNYVYNASAGGNAELASERLLYGGTGGYLSNRLSSALETNFNNKQLYSDYYIQNASFLRMDNLSVGYSFDKLFKTRLSGRISVTAQNLFVITKYKGLDPEIENGVDDNFYPRPRIFLFALNLNF